jgi:hypothetical protein
MNKLGARSITLFLILNLLLACQSIHKIAVQPTNENTWKLSCPPLPSTFQESDLIGTWVASYSLNDKDILTLKEDGTYKQVYDDPDSGQRYESGWQKWWIEQRDSGFIRLYLKGMRRAGEIESIFNRAGGGIDPDIFTAIDYCEGEIVAMPDEIVLIVTGAKNEVPRGIILRQTRLAGSEWTWSFELQEEMKPEVP